MSACTTSSAVITTCALMHDGAAMIAMTVVMEVMREVVAVGFVCQSICVKKRIIILELCLCGL